MNLTVQNTYNFLNKIGKIYKFGCNFPPKAASENNITTVTRREMFYHQTCNMSNTIGATFGAGPAYPSGTREIISGV